MWVHAGRVKGRVVKAPTKTEEQVTQGRLTFQDVGGALRSCSFAADNVRLAPVTVLSKLSNLCPSVSNKTCQDSPFPIACTQNRRMCWSFIWKLMAETELSLGVLARCELSGQGKCALQYVIILV